MFKLIKILNSGVNVPEISKLEKPSSLKIKRGSALILNGGLAANCSETQAPAYIAISDADNGTEEVVCHAVNSDMLFETTVNASPEALLIGNKVTLGKDSDSNICCVSATTASGVATIVDLMGAGKSGDKITVKF